MSVENIIKFLINFWSKHGVVFVSSVDLPKGAITLHPEVVFSILKNKNRKIMMVDRCLRTDDSMFLKYGCRLAQHHQFQVVFIKNRIKNKLDLYKKSIYEMYKCVFKNVQTPYLEFKQDNWKHEILKAKGFGWEVRLGGIEISQITYFQSLANKQLEYEVLELTYGIERIACILQQQFSVQNLIWGGDIKYSDLFYEFEKEVFCMKNDSNFYNNLSKQFETHFDNMVFLKKNKQYRLAYYEFLTLSNILNFSSNFLTHEESRKYILHLSNELSEIVDEFCKQKQ